MLSRLCLSLVVIALTAGCSRGETVKCAGGTAYQSAGSAGQLRIPDDLSVPDETEALRIPDQVAARDREDGVECLEYSPAFSEELDESEEE